MKYTGLSLGPQSPNFVPGCLAQLSEEPSQSCRERPEFVGIVEEEISVKWWATFYLDLHHITHNMYSSGSQTII